jgi:hypothetical protein
MSRKLNAMHKKRLNEMIAEKKIMQLSKDVSKKIVLNEVLSKDAEDYIKQIETYEKAINIIKNNSKDLKSITEFLSQVETEFKTTKSNLVEFPKEEQKIYKRSSGVINVISKFASSFKKIPILLSTIKDFKKKAKEFLNNPEEKEKNLSQLFTDEIKQFQNNLKDELQISKISGGIELDELKYDPEKFAKEIVNLPLSSLNTFLLKNQVVKTPTAAPTPKTNTTETGDAKKDLESKLANKSIISKLITNTEYTMTGPVLKNLVKDKFITPEKAIELLNKISG